MIDDYLCVRVIFYKPFISILQASSVAVTRKSSHRLSVPVISERKRSRHRSSHRHHRSPHKSSQNKHRKKTRRKHAWSDDEEDEDEGSDYNPDDSD